MALWTSILLTAAALSSIMVDTTALPLAPQGGTQPKTIPLTVPRPTYIHTQQATSSLPLQSLSSIMPQVASISSTLHTETISSTANISPSPTTIATPAPENQDAPTAPESELPSLASEEEPPNVLQAVPTDAGKQESRPATATRDITAAARRTLQKALLSAQTATILLQRVLVHNYGTIFVFCTQYILCIPSSNKCWPQIYDRCNPVIKSKYQVTNKCRVTNWGHGVWVHVCMHTCDTGCFPATTMSKRKKSYNI